MTAQDQTTDFANFSSRVVCPAPISLETMAVMEQVLARALGELRNKMAGSIATNDGAVEYESWLPQGPGRSMP